MQNNISQDIITGCCNNNMQCQEALYKYCYPAMMKVCLRYAKDRDDAASLYNKAMLKVFTTIRTYNDEGKLLQWISTIIINTCIDNVRIKPPAMHPLQDEYNDALYVDAEPVSRLSAKEILVLVQGLPEHLRLVFNLYAIEGYSHKEIAGMLDIEESTSRSQYTRAKAMLEEILIKKKIIQKPASKIYGAAASPN